MDAAAPLGDRAAAQRRLQFWQQEAARLERDRANLRFVLPAGLALAIAAWAMTKEVWWGAALFGLASATWSMGLYMTTVRRQEYDYKVAEAQAELQPLLRNSDPAG